ncbi:beta-galactosidase [Caldicellulosiruptoraceae bacterium PP1]
MIKKHYPFSMAAMLYNNYDRGRNMKAEKIMLTKDGIKIGDNYKILLCSSLFYFRIPEEEWEDRIKKIKLAGYNCLDVYFPWNYHEVEEGKWIFDGNRDVVKFLNIVKENEMYVVARPGPYICSEWDLGGLPAYLLSKRDISLREVNDVFLRYVGKWYEKIIPIISKYQITEGGPIIAIQVENELDFYNCSDKKNYLSKLVDFIKKYDIDVPLIACVGQGDVEGATGLLDSLVSTFNFYPDIKDSTIENKLYYYLDLMQRKNLPFLITETGREHFLLKRLLASGAKLIGAYNQVGGTNFEFYNAINNWGNPLSLIACDYDFNSLVSAFGEINEKEFLEARLLSKLINSLNDLITTSTIEDNNDIFVESVNGSICPVSKIMNLSDYGKMVSLVNIAQDEANIKINIDKDVFPRSTNLKVKSLQCKYVFINLDLKKWDINGEILFSSAEPCFIGNKSEEFLMVFHTDDEAEIIFKLDSVSRVEGDIDSLDEIIFKFTKDDVEKSATIFLKNGKKLKIIGLNSNVAAKIEKIDKDLMYLNNFGNNYIKQKSRAVSCRSNIIDRLEEIEYGVEKFKGQRAMFLENVGIYKGCAWYKLRYEMKNKKKIKGLAMSNASDILSIYINEDYIGTFLNDGECIFLDKVLNIEEKEIEVLVKAEIWGHCNFDDNRKNSLKICSLKGLNNASLIFDISDITDNWYLFKEGNHKTPPIFTNFGIRQTTKKQFEDHYYKKIFISKEAENCYLWFKGFECNGELFINQKPICKVDKYHQMFDVSEYIERGSFNEVKVVVTKDYFDDKSGKVYLLEGISSKECAILYSEPTKLYELAKKSKDTADKITLPIIMKSKHSLILRLEMDTNIDYTKVKALFKGKNLKITAISKEQVIGRIWLEEKKNISIFRGGNPDILYLPKNLLQAANNELILYLEPTKIDDNSILEEIEMIYME